jgi:hypothetical protein
MSPVGGVKRRTSWSVGGDDTALGTACALTSSMLALNMVSAEEAAATMPATAVLSVPRALRRSPCDENCRPGVMLHVPFPRIRLK